MLTKKEASLLAKRIEEEQEFDHSIIGCSFFPERKDLWNVGKNTTYTKYRKELENTQGLNSDKSNKPIHHKKTIPINKCFPKLINDSQLLWFNTKRFLNNCSYNIENYPIYDEEYNILCNNKDDCLLDNKHNFEITITPTYDSKRAIQDMIRLTKISFLKAQWYINPSNRHKLVDTSTLPYFEINVCKKWDENHHLHIIVYDQTIRNFKVLIYYLFFIFKTKAPLTDIEYHNLIHTPTMQLYIMKQVEQTLTAKDVFGDFETKNKNF